MKNITFKSITVVGFRSISRHIKFHLDHPGLSLLKGKNGVGKTTIFEALIWALYGVNLKGTTNDKIITWEELQDGTFKGTRVSVDFVVDDILFTIYRHIDYEGTTLGIKGLNGLMLVKEETLLGDGLHKSDTQTIIDELIGMDSKAFVNSILFGQRMKRLIESDNTDKRNLFEKLFDAEFIGEARIKAKKDLDELIDTFDGLDAQYNLDCTQLPRIESELERANALISKFYEEKDEKVALLDIQIHGYEDSIQTTSSFISNFQNKEPVNLDEVNNAENSVRKLIKERDKIAMEVDTLQAKFKSIQTLESLAEDAYADANDSDFRYKEAVKNWKDRHQQDVKSNMQAIEGYEDARCKRLENIPQNCPTCGHKLTDDEKVEKAINEEFNEKVKLVVEQNKKLMKEKCPIIKETHDLAVLNEAVAKLGDDLADLDKELTAKMKLQDKKQPAINKMEAIFHALNNKYDDYLKTKAMVEEWEAEVKEDTIKLDMTHKTKKDVLATTPPEIDTKGFIKQIEELKKVIDINEAKLDVSEDEIDIVKWWVSTGFSSKGLSAYIFKSMLGTLNDHLYKYGEKLGVSVEFSVDLTKTSKPFITKCSIGDKIDKEYKEFSGGQKQRLDIVMIFAMHDLICQGNNINILIMDEVFEGLDEEGESVVFDLIRMKVEEGKSVYVITHSPHIDSMYSRTIEIFEEGGITCIE